MTSAVGLLIVTVATLALLLQGCGQGGNEATGNSAALRVKHTEGVLGEAAAVDDANAFSGNSKCIEQCSQKLRQNSKLCKTACGCARICSESRKGMGMHECTSGLMACLGQAAKADDSNKQVGCFVHQCPGNSIMDEIEKQNLFGGM
mmetsp:Transcript_55987/g.126319  ORF Transcript_55987/g.126319 Transcript_55987/m.126319 type:complete len:147 (-) Transcript_55987:156-596(-)|eukprot:CAMPEP_0197871958 /NCGR_PEP_ID=MMETSP1439-20131203/2225_1 /TAXON_ID=66791 /ORGANISM="Gonyaulax spinifera, Strain CCMP409" /LENGTH=146 /DNA_ID=CAMNT_0043490925 /DNA_START=45 /DNA_END=485 /DNA_ORIENTATION=-